jgi:hypothetical protein
LTTWKITRRVAKIDTKGIASTATSTAMSIAATAAIVNTIGFFEPIGIVHHRFVFVIDLTIIMVLLAIDNHALVHG